MEICKNIYEFYQQLKDFNYDGWKNSWKKTNN